MSNVKSYEKHKEAWSQDLADTARQDVHKLWFRTDTADYWRHARMYEAVGAFTHRPELSWVTIGDGRFGLDSIRLQRLGVQSVLPTDIGGALLEAGVQQGLINDYRVENAESLSFSDDSFDVVFCKESYHHFPRPFLALAEMVRVARYAVILVEPRDYVIDRPQFKALGPKGLVRGLWSWMMNRLKIPGKPLPLAKRYQLGDAPHYEDCGNYMYTISSREMEKFALGLNLPTLALKGLNDCFLPEGGTAPATEDSPVFMEMKREIEKADQLAESGRAGTSMLMVILFNQAPDAVAREFLGQRGWLVKDLPRNPHLT